jgi:group I intron endonuclease
MTFGPVPVFDRPVAYVYMITSPRGKMYVGQTHRDVQKRWNEHIKDAKSGNGSCRLIGRALQKYGADAMQFRVLAVVEDLAAALDFEQKAIAAYNTLAPNGYNLTTGGEGWEPSEEARGRMSAAHIGKTLTPEHRAKMSAANTGKTHTPETRAKIGAAHIGKPLTPETRAKIGAANTGKTHTPESRARMSAARTGKPKPFTPEYRARVSSLGRINNICRFPTAMRRFNEEQHTLAAEYRRLCDAGLIPDAA